MGAAPASAEEIAASGTIAPAPSVKQGDALVAPPTEPAEPQNDGGVVAEPEADVEPTPEAEPEPDVEADGGYSAASAPPPVFSIPTLPSASCGPGAIPAILIPIYQRAADAYGLGPQGPSVLAAINEIETAFGTNLNVSSAGAVGWMQFMPETWDGYGVDANGDGVADPYNPEDAIFAAANYLSASGFPTDVYGAIFAYNHADWYVAEVLANAECYGLLGNAVAGAFDLTPKLQVLSCVAPKRWRKRIPAEYLDASESAAARYGLGQRGVWALAAVARLESNFGRGMDKADLRRSGPLGLDPAEWQRFAVDGDGDGRLRHSDPDDSAATLARLVWSRGGLRAGLFSHNQAEWYVEAVLSEAERLEGDCVAERVEWAFALPNVVIAPINWDNLTILNQVAKEDLEQGRIDPRIVGLLGAISQGHQLTISSLRSDHSMHTAEGGVSNHYYGRAMDIAAVDGVSCTDTAPTSPCAELALTFAALPAPAMPTELIYCFDVDGPGPAFARSDHCDHVHAGYDG
ncbi:MAG TPA: lytic murein transglycosylase [Solirubrobacterales bacterium]|nr:lytic murein transglycosylase [Solirubrobacterales bacterium]